MNMKKVFSIIVVIGALGYSFDCKALMAHEPFFSVTSHDIGGAISRGLQAAIKLFLSDDNEIVAELVYDGEEGESSGGGAGGNGGAYTGDKGTAKFSLSALVSPITDIPAEKGAYPEDVKIQQTSIDELAKYRVQSVVQEQASLDQLSADKWAIQYRAQQRAIQAMTDALVMKKAYKDLAAIAEMVSPDTGSYSNYSEAVSTVATRRLLLDELMALRKRVIAARVRARAETMEMDIDTVATAPAFEESKTASVGGETAQSGVINRATGATADSNENNKTGED